MKRRNFFKIKLQRQAGFFLLSLFLLKAGFAQEMPVPVELQLQLFSKILTFDKNLEQRGRDSLRIAVIYQKLYRYSDNTRKAFYDAAEKLQLRQIKGFPVRLLSKDLVVTADLRKLLTEQKIDIIYIAPLRATPVSEITKVSRELKVLSLSGVTDYMMKGVSVGLDIKGDRAEILINLNNSREEGADFSSRLLQLARIIN